MTNIEHPQPSNSTVDDDVARFKKHLDQLESRTPASIVARLHQSRNHALNSKPRQSRIHWAMGAATFASIAVFMMFSILPNSQNTSQPNSAVASQSQLLQNFEMLSGDVELDMISDLEFYQWLDENDLGQQEAINETES
ncbi:hypothetical protein [Pleionea litopenaei]|uniref:DUF3619 family protein n=1 Tax=Pleionea litopenaei TaxID=3070815 RepID=A0AA51RV37_9GAMM|nr:hypothetical protein [Pleionea sp. HL-JVS1]WMS88171.1 hypothetical protein Q9312_04460 [Pleionea sp. HL-JVS1]